MLLQSFEMTDEILCSRALTIPHMQKYCSCFPQCFFGYSLHCQWMHDLKPKWIFFLRCQCHFYHLLKAISKIVNTAIFVCQKEEFTGHCRPSVLRVSSKGKIQIAHHVRIWIRKFWKMKFGSHAINASKSSFYVLHPMHWQHCRDGLDVFRKPDKVPHFRL